MVPLILFQVSVPPFVPAQIGYCHWGKGRTIGLALSPAMFSVYGVLTKSFGLRTFNTILVNGRDGLVRLLIIETITIISFSSLLNIACSGMIISIQHRVECFKAVYL